MDANAMGAELLKNPQFLEMFQAAMGDDKVPEEGDPEREAWLKKIQQRLATQSKEEAKKRLEQPVTDDDGQWMYVVPDPGFCIKCHTIESGRGKGKVFINICKHEKIAEPMPFESNDPEMKETIQYRVPLSCGALRMDTDKAGNPAKVYDVIVNPATIERCNKESEFRRFVAALCMTWIKQKSEPNLDADQFTNVNIRVKGRPEMQRIRLAAPKQDGEGNALNDEIKLPGAEGKTASGATAPTSAAPKSQGKMVMEILPEEDLQRQREAQEEAQRAKRKEMCEKITNEGKYDWTKHQKPTRNQYFRAVVPEFIDVQVVLEEIQQIAEVEVNIENRTIELQYVDAEEGEKPFHVVTLEFPVDSEPVSAKFVKKTKTLQLKLKVVLPDEVEEEKQRHRDHVVNTDKEDEEERRKEQEREKKLKEAQERHERIQREEKEILQQRKLFVENLNALNAGQVPPELMQEINAMPEDQARALMVRLESGKILGDQFDSLLEKMPPEVIRDMCNRIRQRLGLEPLPIPQQEAAIAKKMKAEEQQPVEQTYDFAKKCEQLFGVKLYNRYVFALEH